MTPDRWWLAWSTDPLILFGLAVLAWVYIRGTRAVWRIAGRGRGVRTWQIVAFGAGWLSVFVALVSPLDQLSDQLFSAHMVQHLLLMTIAAPLIALAQAVPALVWAWPRRTRLKIGRALHVLTPLVLNLPVAFVLHSLALWAWHIPALYEAALRVRWLHATEHLVLVGTGILFWSAAWAQLGRATAGLGIGLVFALGLQCSALGALLVFATRPWYAFYGETTAAWGVSAIDDQVLAGVIMWVPGGMVYLVCGLVLLSAWLARRPQAPATQSAPAPPSPLSQNR